MTRISDLDTPAAVIDTTRMQRNITRMQDRMNALGVKFRPHVKTSKHGIVCSTDGVDREIARRFPIGTRLRILPNHACATGAQYPDYHAVLASGDVEPWPRFYGW